MRKVFITLSFLLLFAGVSMAQKGTAEPGYYPGGYAGETWTGDVTAVDEITRAFILTYTNDNKSKTFTGILPKGYSVKMKDGKDYELKMKDIKGMIVKAYFITKTRKDDLGAKVKINEVFKIIFMKDK